MLAGTAVIGTLNFVGLKPGTTPCVSSLKELCHGVFIYFSDLTKLFSH